MYETKFRKYLCAGGDLFKVSYFRDLLFPGEVNFGARRGHTILKKDGLLTKALLNSKRTFSKMKPDQNSVYPSPFYMLVRSLPIGRRRRRHLILSIVSALFGVRLRHHWCLSLRYVTLLIWCNKMK